jgi:glycosyltransferase involved in cell wall biosynthesis
VAIQGNPLISIYLPTHNRVDMLERALNSIYSQTYKNYEILICDDGSSDKTQERMLDLVAKNNQVRYLRNPIPMGACTARNLGIFAASGEFITGLDDDDEFTQDRLEKLLASWRDEYSFVSANFLDRFADALDKLHYASNRNIFTLRDLLQRNEASNQIFTKTERLRSIGGFRVDVKRLQDWDAWLRLCDKYGNFIRLASPLYVMHHDYDSNKSRVSESISFSVALEELLRRNIELYDQKSKFLLTSNIRLLQNNYSLMDMFKNIIYTKSARPVYHFCMQRNYQK